MDELELRHAEAHYAEMPRDGYSGRCEMLLPEDLRGMRVLDLGCRNGKGAYKLADRVGPDGFVLGVDPSAACVARAEATAAAARACRARAPRLKLSSFAPAGAALAVSSRMEFRPPAAPDCGAGASSFLSVGSSTRS